MGRPGELPDAADAAQVDGLRELFDIRCSKAAGLPGSAVFFSGFTAEAQRTQRTAAGMIYITLYAKTFYNSSCISNYYNTIERSLRALRLCGEVVAVK
jgi:hypothetical protein